MRLSRWYHRARRLLASGALLLMLALALSGCMQVERKLRLNSDGSGTYALTVGFRQPKAGDSSSIPANTVTTMEAFGAHVQQQGGTYRRYDDQGYTYWTYSRPFASLTQANSYLQDDPRQYDQSHFPLLYQDSLHVSEEPGPFAAALHVTGIISLTDPLDKAENWRDATESVTITMPEGVSAHQGGVSDGNGVTYTIRYNESTRVDVRGNVTRASGAGTALLAVAIAVVALGLAGVGLWLVRRPARKR